MVVALKPGRFYGKSLPRPHLYSDLKFNSERVDPPPPINDALIRWANEAHWSMGGLSFKRRRMQGKIEGRIHKIRAEEEHQHHPGADGDDFLSPRKTKKGLGSEPQQNMLIMSVSPIDALLLADAKEGEMVANSVRIKGRSLNPSSSPMLMALKMKRPSVAAEKLPVRPKRTVKRALLVEDDQGSDSDDGLEEFLKEGGRPLRRSGRLKVAIQYNPKDENKESDGEDKRESPWMRMKQQQPHPKSAEVVSPPKHLRRRISCVTN